MKKPAAKARFVLGRARFERISAIEGIGPNKALAEDFRSFDDRKLPAVKRREILAKKYGGKV